MGRAEIRIIGFGGQGVVTSGIVLGRAASVYDDIYSCQSQSYGPEARGGAARADVIISEEQIDYPMVMSADVLMAMSDSTDESVEDNLQILDREGILIADSGLVKDIPNEGEENVHRIKATELAEERIGKRLFANTVMLGYFASKTDIISLDAIKQAIKDMVPSKSVEQNMEAFDLGYEQP